MELLLVCFNINHLDQRWYQYCSIWNKKNENLKSIGWIELTKRKKINLFWSLWEVTTLLTLSLATRQNLIAICITTVKNCFNVDIIIVFYNDQVKMKREIDYMRFCNKPIFVADLGPSRERAVVRMPASFIFRHWTRSQGCRFHPERIGLER